MILYRQLNFSDLDGLNCIDRSDYSESWCTVKNGKIIQYYREFKHPGFSSHDWEQILSKYAVKLEHGCKILFGAFENKILVGLSGLDIDRRYGIDLDMFNFGPMWVSHSYRGQGIGKQLLGMAVQEAKNRNTHRLYVSATPVPKTVGFYLHAGCTLLSNPDPQLFMMEPEDIHMELQL